jgi:hypothetical protein
MNHALIFFFVLISIGKRSLNSDRKLLYENGKRDSMAGDLCGGYLLGTLLMSFSIGCMDKILPSIDKMWLF